MNETDSAVIALILLVLGFWGVVFSCLYIRDTRGDDKDKAFWKEHWDRWEDHKMNINKHIN